MHNLSLTSQSFSRCCFTVKRLLLTWGFTQAREEALGWQLRYLRAIPEIGWVLPVCSLRQLNLVKSSGHGQSRRWASPLTLSPCKIVRLG